MNDLKPLKSFWEKPQGTVGMVGVGALVFGAGWLILKNAAWLALAMSNLTTAVFMGLGLFAIAWLISDKQFRNLIWYLYKGMIEKVTSIFIEIDPIGIMKVYVSELKNKRGKMNGLLGDLKKEIGKLKRDISDNKVEISTLLNKASIASKSGDRRMQARTSLNTRKAGRRKNSTIKLADILVKVNSLYAQMDKMYFYSGIMIEDVEDQVDNIERERKIVHASYGVMKHAQSIIAGDDNKAQMFDRALDFVVEDLGSKMGEMERFMDLSKNFMDGVDLDNEVFEIEGLSMLEEWEENNTLDFISQGSVDYLQMIDTKMYAVDEQPELVEIKSTNIEPLKPKKIGNKKFF